MKERLDVLLVKKGFYPSRERAKASIMAGIVFVDGQRSDKAGNMVDTEAEIQVKENICPYVSRGGLKLEKSMKDLADQLERKNMYGYWRFNWRLHRLHAAKRCSKSICCRCRIWSA